MKVALEVAGQRDAVAAAREVENSRILREWSATEGANRLSQLPLTGLEERTGARMVPSGSDNMDFVQWTPPGSTIAAQALSGVQARSVSGRPRLQGILRSAWDSLHKGLRASSLAKLENVHAWKSTPCYAAGFCMCDEHGSRLQAFVKAFQRELRATLVRGSEARQAFDRGFAILRLSTHGLDGEGEVSWFHLGYGNLTTFRFALLRVSRVDAHQGRVAESCGRVALQFCNSEYNGLDIGTLWSSFQHLDLDLRWGFEMWKLYCNSDSLPAFAPGLHLQAYQLPGARLFWDLSVRRRRLPVKGQRAPRASMDPAAVVVGEPMSDEDEGGDPWGLQNEDASGALEDAAGRLAAAEALGWQLQGGDSAEEEEAAEEGDQGSPLASKGPPADAVLEGSLAEVAQAMPNGSLAEVDRTVPEGSLAEVARGSQDVPSDRARPPGPGRGAGVSYMRWPVGDIGHLVYDQHHNSMAAHCSQHTLCRLNRTLNGAVSGHAGRGRPLGFLIAWLRARA